MKKTTDTTNTTSTTDAKIAVRSAVSATPRRKPKQPRSIATFNAILEAAATLFATHGYELTTTHQMAKAAGVSVGALYRYFDGKEAILREVYREETKSLRHRILASFTIAELVGQDLPALVHKAMTHAFQIYAERPGLRRVLVEQARKVPELAEIRKEQEREVHDAVRAIFNAAPGVQIPDIEIGAYLIVLFMEALIDDHTLYRTPIFDAPRVINGATDFILRYALGSAAPTDLEAPER
ncbi:MAG: TetR/AcrR family transcriptional regulator [Deltaproteobacteria bacterium]|nr:TetR/AcrR family transcriptional regulator [Deltaproteobacteria bacterium]